MKPVQSPPAWKQIFNKPFICYSPSEIKRIRETLGETQEVFAQRFFVSVDAVQSWEAKEGSTKHRECLGAAARLMYWCAVEASERGSAKGNLIRLAIRYGAG